MKVIKAKDIPQKKTVAGEIDLKLVEELQEKFDTMKQILDTKTYGIFLDAELANFLFETFFGTIQWKGAEAYVITAASESISDLSQKDGSIQGQIRPEIVEGIFHLIKSFTSSGIENARLFKRMADQFAMVVQEINQDRQELKDLSLELVAAEKGITVETLTGELQKNPDFLDK
jgi:hypothetical protein